ncbi:hypothetical protein E4U53_005006 [Claviceps sorghi]|nr:hypothetical protein E4U53_005006 [Claviceps sorghi]
MAARPGMAAADCNADDIAGQSDVDQRTTGHLPQNARPLPPPPPGRLVDETSRYLSFFDLFAKSNSLTGRSRTTGDEVKQLGGLHSRKGSHVLHAMLAVGGMFAGRRNLVVDAAARRETGLVALQHYSYSIAALREAIDGLDFRSRTRQQRKLRDEHVCVLWTTLLLGLFELMNDATGHGWQRHIIHGTCMALQASGPSSCRSAAGFAFFTHARIFEISRTILYNETTFLSEPAWLALSRESRSGGEYSSSPLDSLLDIMVMCSDLRVRGATLSHRIRLSPSWTPTTEAMAVSNAGFKLREALESWRSAYLPTPPAAHNGLATNPPEQDIQQSPPTRGPSVHDPNTLLSHVFHASISIYLSGIFDYHLPQWQTLCLPVPTLTHDTITHHVRDIVVQAGTALDSTSLSPLLFLFPLRIAGARCRHEGQRNAVRRLVARIAKEYAVGSTIEADLSALWEFRAAGNSPDQGVP